MPQRTNKYELKNSAGNSSTYNDIDSKLVIYRCEIRIINCITARPRTQKSISHKVGLNSSIVHELICDLLLRGYIEQTRKRRLYFWHSDLFSATVEGLAMAERTKRGS
jgi:DNA-binding MarR family transcriptional regulator